MAEQRPFERRLTSRHRIEAGERPRFEQAIVRRVGNAVERDGACRAGRRHAVIGDDHQIGGLAECAQARDERSDLGVDLLDRFGRLGRVGAKAVARAVDGIEIERDEARALRRRTAQPVDHARDALFARHRLVEWPPILGPHPAIGRAVTLERAAPRDVRTRPEHRRAAHSPALGRDPERLGGVPPEGVLRILHRELLARPRDVLHRVRDDAVAIGPEAGDERPVVREGLGGERRPHRRADPACGERIEVRRHPARAVIGAEAVDRDEDRDGRPRFRAQRAGARSGGGRGDAGLESGAQGGGKDLGGKTHVRFPATRLRRRYDRVRWARLAGAACCSPF